MVSPFISFTMFDIPPAYLADDETSKVSNECLLLSIHQNTSTWYLFTGSHSIVDTFSTSIWCYQSTARYLFAAVPVPSLPFTESLWFPHFDAVTETATHKQEDRILLLVLLVIAWASDLVYCRNSAAARRWLRSEGVDARAASFHFSERTSILGDHPTARVEWDQQIDGSNPSTKESADSLAGKAGKKRRRARNGRARCDARSA